MPDHVWLSGDLNPWGRYQSMKSIYILYPKKGKISMLFVYFDLINVQQNLVNCRYGKYL